MSPTGYNKKSAFDSYYQALASLEKKLPVISLITGGQEYFRFNAVKALEKTARKHYPELEIIHYQGDAGSGEPGIIPATLLQELCSRSLFSSSKLIVVKRAERLLSPNKSLAKTEKIAASKAVKKHDSRQRLVEYFNSPNQDMFIAFESQKFDKRSRLGKALKQNALVIDCPQLRWESEVLTWLKRKVSARGFSLEAQAAHILYTVHGAEPTALTNEIEKLIIFLADKPRIDSEAVKEFMGDSIALTGFELTNAVEAKEEKKAIKAARRLVTQGISDTAGKHLELSSSVHMVLGSLRNCLVRLWEAHAIVSEGGNLRSLEQNLGLRGKRAEHIFRAAEKYSLRELKYALVSLAEALTLLHDTGSDPGKILEEFVVKIFKYK